MSGIGAAIQASASAVILRWDRADIGNHDQGDTTGRLCCRLESRRQDNLCRRKLEMSLGAQSRDDTPAAADRVGAWISRWLRLLVRLAYQWTWAEVGMPSLAIRLSTLHPIFASVF
jgi:hypothetical protein